MSSTDQMLLALQGQINELRATISVMSQRITNEHNHARSLAKRIESLEAAQRRATLKGLRDTLSPERRAIVEAVHDLDPTCPGCYCNNTSPRPCYLGNPRWLEQQQGGLAPSDPLQCECGEHLDLCEGHHEPDIQAAIEALSYAQCPYYRGTGICNGDCRRDEPYCQTGEPTEGWVAYALSLLTLGDNDGTS